MFLVWDVLFGFGVVVLFGYVEIDDVDNIRGFCFWVVDEEVIRFDVLVNEVFFVNGLNMRKYLFCNYDDGFDGEFMIIMVK